MKKIDRFRIVRHVGEAGEAALYKAEEQLAGGLSRAVLLKVYPPGPRAQADAAMLRELRSLLAVDGHPFIIPLHGAGAAEGATWLAMEWPETTLESRLTEQGGDAAEVCAVLRNIGAALAALHGLEPPVLHNAVNPAAIVIASGGFYKLGDFAAAGCIGEESTLPAAMAPYAAPEILNREFGRPGPSADLYALGHVAYLLALGLKNHRRQFTGVFDERTGGRDAGVGRWMAWHCSLNTPLPPAHAVRRDFPESLGRVIARLTAKNPESRYATAKEMLSELEAATTVAAAAPPAPAQQRPAIGPPRRPGPAPAPPAVAAPRGSPRRTAPASPGDSPAPAAPRPAAGGTMLYHVRLRDRRSGPYDWATLVKHARMGLISRLHQISTDQINWKPAGSIQGLFEDQRT